jgi:5'-3' exonuclease
MGIPFYFKSIVHQHPGIVVPLSKAKKSCDRLFLDFNCAVHQCAQSVMSKMPTATFQTIEFEILRETLLFLKDIIESIAPKHLVYVAVDGVCPLAKMVQQRKRRYVSMWRHQLLQEEAKRLNITLCQWDTNAITPGTAFMEQLNASLKNMETAFNAMNRQHGGPIMVVSDSSEHGEGEHKIMDYLREFPDDSRRDMIYGLDADLIMLSMISKASDKIFLVREKPVFNLAVRIHEAYLTLDIAQLKTMVHQDIHRTYHAPGTVDSIVRDYVALCWLIGNDFLPPLSYLKIKENGIQILLQTYASLKTDMQQPLIDEEGIINHLFLLQLFGNLSRNEDVMMDEVNRNYYDRKVQPNKNQEGIKPMMNYIDNWPTFHKYPQIIDTSQKGWRPQYYRHLFKSQPCATVHDICSSYIEGLFWTAMYYFTGKAPKNWAYSHNYSPTILDVYNYMFSAQTSLLEIIDQSFQSLSNITIFPTLQLLFVLPPSSNHLIPKLYLDIQKEIKKGCTHYFPTQFEICTYLKHYLWEASPVLPFVDVTHLHDTLNTLTQEEGSVGA